MSIRINGENFDITTRMSSSEVTITSDSDFINESAPTFNDAIWNSDPNQLEYTIKASHEKRWILEQIYNNHDVVILVDIKHTDKTLYMFIQKLNAIYSSEVNYPWLVSISLIKLTDSEFDSYFGFEKIDDDNLFEEGFERVYY
jgi:hypothetical protein